MCFSKFLTSTSICSLKFSQKNTYTLGNLVFQVKKGYKTTQIDKFPLDSCDNFIHLTKKILYEYYVAAIYTNNIKFGYFTLIFNEVYLFYNQLSGKNPEVILCMIKSTKYMKDIQTKNTVNYEYTMKYNQILVNMCYGYFKSPTFIHIYTIYH